MGELFANAAESTLDADIDDSVTSLDLVDASTFPASGDFRILIMAEGANTPELLKVTAVAGNTLTVERGAEAYAGSSTPSAHAGGARVVQVLTAGSLATVVVAAVPWITVAPNGWVGGTPDYQCDGVNDEVEIQAALDYAGTLRTSLMLENPPVRLLPGVFYIDGQISVASRGRLEGTSTAGNMDVGNWRAGRPATSIKIVSDPWLGDADDHSAAPIVLSSSAVLENIYIPEGPVSWANTGIPMVSVSGSNSVVRGVIIDAPANGDAFVIDNGGGTVDNCYVDDGANKIRARWLTDTPLDQVAISDGIAFTNPGPLGIPNGSGAPSGNPALNGWWLPWYKDNTAVTGGLYHWDGSAWVEDAAIM